MKFCWTTIMVKNMEESLYFYQEIIGLKVNRKFKAGPGVELAFLGDGDTEVELICNDQLTDISFGKDISLGFEVKSLEELIPFLSDKGIKNLSGPFMPNPHTKFIYISDPNGLKIQFVENL